VDEDELCKGCIALVDCGGAISGILDGSTHAHGRVNVVHTCCILLDPPSPILIRPQGWERGEWGGAPRLDFALGQSSLPTSSSSSVHSPRFGCIARAILGWFLGPSSPEIWKNRFASMASLRLPQGSIYACRLGYSKFTLPRTVRRKRFVNRILVHRKVA